MKILDGNLVAGGAHVCFRAKTKRSGTTGRVKSKDNALPLSQHAKDRTVESVVGQFVFREIGVGDDKTLFGLWVVSLDDALHDYLQRYLSGMLW